MKKCFTLIELLVVISIIVILTSLIVPAVSHVRKKAKQVSCLQNVKQGTSKVFIQIEDQFPETAWDEWTIDSGLYCGMDDFESNHIKTKKTSYAGNAKENNTTREDESTMFATTQIHHPAEVLLVFEHAMYDQFSSGVSGTLHGNTLLVTSMTDGHAEAIKVQPGETKGTNWRLYNTEED